MSYLLHNDAYVARDMRRKFQCRKRLLRQGVLQAPLEFIKSHVVVSLDSPRCRVVIISGCRDTRSRIGLSGTPIIVGFLAEDQIRV